MGPTDWLDILENIKYPVPVGNQTTIAQLFKPYPSRNTNYATLALSSHKRCIKEQQGPVLRLQTAHEGLSGILRNLKTICVTQNILDLQSATETLPASGTKPRFLTRRQPLYSVIVVHTTALTLLNDHHLDYTHRSARSRGLCSLEYVHT